jgi:hypothetical protein
MSFCSVKFKNYPSARGNIRDKSLFSNFLKMLRLANQNFRGWAQAGVSFMPILPKISPILGGNADELSQVLEAPAVAVPFGAA